MKLLLLLIVLVYATLCQANNNIIGSSSGNGKYVLENSYQESDTTCSNDVVSSKYLLSGGCNLGTMATCNGNVIEYSHFTNSKCTGEPFQTTPFPHGECVGESLKYYCTDSIEFTNGSFIAVYTSDYSCDWKESEITQILITNTNTCIDILSVGASSVSCNSTSLTRSKYDSGSSCSGTPYNVDSFELPQCIPGDYFSSITYICN